MSGSIDLASGMEGMPETWVVLARLRGEDAVDGGDSILVKEREVCSALGLLSREMAGLSEDMAWMLLQRWPKHSTDGGCRRYDAACTVTRGVLGVMGSGMQDWQKQKQKRAGEEYGVGMGRRGSRADNVCRMALLVGS